MTVEAYAKVNLTLEVYGRRPDGYHALRSVVQPIGLADTLEVELTGDGVVASDTGYGEDDLVVKAARRLLAGRSLGCRVRVVKRIPAGGGLGGGSADAAAALLALNRLLGRQETPEALARIGAEVGSDVPALVLAQHYGGPVLMEGRGERVSLLPEPLVRRLPGASAVLVLANPGVHSSTPEVFARCTPRAGEPEGEPDLRPGNDLQAAATALHPEIAEALRALREAGASPALMSGSGATVFGFAESGKGAERIVREMRARGCSAWICALRRRRSRPANEADGAC